MKSYILGLWAIIASCMLASCGANTTTTNAPSTSTTTTGSAVASVPMGTCEAKNIDGVPTCGTGAHTLQIFADFQCPACQQTNTTVTPILEEMANNGKLKIEYRQYPLNQIHKNALWDALAALCANDQGKFSAFKKEMYSFEIDQKGATTSDDQRAEVAKKAGLNVDAFKSCLTSKKFQAQVDADIKLGDSYKIQWTPTYVLDGIILDLSKIPGSTLAEMQAGLKNFLDTYVANPSSPTTPAPVTNVVPQPVNADTVDEKTE